MALDTALKRLSAVFVGSPWRAKLPFPDGTVGRDDRQVVAFHFRSFGVLADTGTPAERIVYALPELRLVYVGDSLQFVGAAGIRPRIVIAPREDARVVSVASGGSRVVVAVEEPS